jgi:hypothetical protein
MTALARSSILAFAIMSQYYVLRKQTDVVYWVLAAGTMNLAVI